MLLSYFTEKMKEGFKIRKLVIVLLFVLALTGCSFESQQEITIEDDNSGVIVQTILFEESLYDSFSSEIEASIDEIEESGEDIQVEEVEVDGKKGMRLTSNFDNLDKLKNLIEDDEDGTTADIDKDIIFNYTINEDNSVSVDIVYKNTADEDGDVTTKIFYDVVISVPKIIDSNAEDVDGDTMHWDFDSETANNITFTYSSVPLITKILTYVGYGLIVFGITIGGYFGYSRFIKTKISKKYQVDELIEEDNNK